MKKEAEKFAEEDKKKKESVEIRNEAETLSGSVRKNTARSEQKVSMTSKNRSKKKLTNLKNSLRIKTPNWKI